MKMDICGNLFFEKIGRTIGPVSLEDVREIQEALSKICSDPKLTIVESHTVDFSCLDFLKTIEG